MMATPRRHRHRYLEDERGAEALEFAIVAPLALFLLLGLLYALLSLAAWLSLGHATSGAVRYAAIPTDPVTATYPDAAAVQDRLVEATPFFGPDACHTTLAGEELEGRVVRLEVACTFPNPPGAVLSGLRNAFFGGDGSQAYGTELTMTARAEARRE